jgi:hypothetical protein
MLPGTRRYCSLRDVSRHWTRPPTLPSALSSLAGLQTFIDAVEEPESSRNAQPTRSASPRVTDGLRASIHAPPDPSTGTLQAPGDDTENLEEEPTHSMTRSSSTRSGSDASIHAPAAGQSGQSAQRSSKHHTDVPNWAAICRAEKSSTEGSTPAKCGGDSPIQPRLSMKARQSHRQPRGAQPAIRKEAPLTTPMDRPWSTQTIRKTQQ